MKVLQEARGAADRTVARRLSSLSSLHQHAKRRGWPSLVNPVDSEDHRPQIDRHDDSPATPVLEKEQIQALAAAATDAREALIVLLLWLNTRSLVKTAIVLLAVPFSAIGAIWLMAALDYNVSIATWAATSRRPRNASRSVSACRRDTRCSGAASTRTCSASRSA